MEIENAVKLMFKTKIKKLPVVKKGKLIGLVTLTDHHEISASHD